MWFNKVFLRIFCSMSELCLYKMERLEFYLSFFPFKPLVVMLWSSKIDHGLDEGHRKKKTEKNLDGY